MIILLGVGFAMFQNYNGKALILAAPLHRIGAAGGIQSTVRVIGTMIGPSCVGLCFHLFVEDGDGAPHLRSRGKRGGKPILRIARRVDSDRSVRAVGPDRRSGGLSGQQFLRLGLLRRRVGIRALCDRLSRRGGCQFEWGTGKWGWIGHMFLSAQSLIGAARC